MKLNTTSKLARAITPAMVWAGLAGPCVFSPRGRIHTKGREVLCEGPKIAKRDPEMFSMCNYFIIIYIYILFLFTELLTLNLHAGSVLYTYQDH